MFRNRPRIEELETDWSTGEETVRVGGVRSMLRVTAALAENPFVSVTVPTKD